ncbi:MAG: EamA family transporter [Nocardioides sp.]|jgi:probable blue pigment (indigoidine) exporter
MSSVETNIRWILLTAVAPIAWGSTYLTTTTFLPEGRPVFSALVRALPVGLLLLVWRRQLPQGSWWWRAGVLGTLNIGVFFLLIFEAAYRLPGGVAATVTALSPLVVMLLAWPLAGERANALGLFGATLGLIGVALLVLQPGGALDPVGVAAALAAVLVSAVGFVLVKRWTPPTDLLTFTSWQLVAGGLVLLPVAFLREGAPPALDWPAVGAYAYLGLVGTGLAYVCWFAGIRHLGAGPTALIGLVNPVVGIGLGVVFASETFALTQGAGVVLVLIGVLLGQPAVRARLRGLATSRRRAVTACADDERRGRECVPAS